MFERFLYPRFAYIKSELELRGLLRNFGFGTNLRCLLSYFLIDFQLIDFQLLGLRITILEKISLNVS
jgi:hypothetical protein